MYPIVVDNFFEDPDSVRNRALNLDYFKDPFLGYTHHLTDSEYTKKVTNIIHSHISESLNIKEFFYVFRYSLDKDKLTTPYDFHEWKVHPDFCDFAGLVYLNPNPPEKTGTSFYTNEDKYVSSVENKYNRLIYYPGTIHHGPTDLFGDTKENARLTLTFFSGMPPKPTERFLAS
tara:strand:+ start:203 stop:724 length:522 start_codon:yes stop_codon:yes gene_type:complete